jgi:TonB family protein
MKFVAAGAIGGVMLGILWGSGCKHAPKGGVYGNTSFRVVEPPRPPPPPGSSREMIEPVSRANYRDAQAIHPLVMPVYPPAALAARAGAATVGVRVTVDASGVVTDVRPSMLAVTITPPEFAEAFREAVEVAVRRWKFAPARVHYLERVTDREFTYERVTRTELIEAEFDLAFTFTPAGKVEAGK